MELFFLALLFVLMAVALGSGFPVAFALPGSAIISIAAAAAAGWLFAGDADAYFASGGPQQWLSAGVTNFRGVYWEVERDTLIAIPLFIFMGIMLQRSKIAEDLLVTMAQLFGPIPGGLGISVVFVGALLAATTGIVGATVVAMGLISLPAMLRNNYSKPLATGTIAASGTLGQIIPPSIVLIILADQLSSAVDQASTARKNLFKDSTGELSMPSSYDVTSASAGDMFLGAFVPGLLLVAIYMAFILIFALLKPQRAPAVGFEGEFDRKFIFRVLLTLIPPLALIILVLGSILAGIATVNQAGAIGAVGATIMAGYRLREGHKGAYTPALLGLASLALIFVVTANFDTNVKNITSSNDALGVGLAVIGVIGLVISIVWSGWRTLKIEDTLKGVMLETAKTTSLVFIILLGAAMLTSAFRAFGGEELVREFLTSLPGGFWVQFVIVMAVIFLLGFFLDFIEIAVVVVPIVAPILLADPGANITAVWLGVMIGLNIQTSFLTPPFGFALFYLRGVAPAEVKTTEIYRGVIAFIALQLCALVVVGLNPALVNYLPNRVSLTSDNAPPPRNPRLQQCVEEYVAEAFAARGPAIESSITRIRAADLSALPEDWSDDLTEAFEKAGGAIPAMAAIAEAHEAVVAKSAVYRPDHALVRGLERDARKIEAHLEELEVRLRRQPETAARTEAEIAELTAERDALLAAIPESWEGTYARFNELNQAENKARTTYRRLVDDAYEPVVEIITIIGGVEDVAAFEDQIRGLRGMIEAEQDLSVASDKVQDLSRAVGDAAGGDEVKSALNQVRRALRGRNASKEKALEELDAAIATFEEDVAWKRAATPELLPQLVAYEAAINDTIGLRQQEKLTRDAALSVASCRSVHRDISLSF